MSVPVQYIVGIDEAGRGPLAGPVAVGVVIAPVGFDIAYEFPGVADSKALSEKKREHLFAMLRERTDEIPHSTIQFSVSFSSATFIDSHGIVPAVQRALDEALSLVAPSPDDVSIFLDGSLHAPERYIQQETIIRGDVTVPIISLASIVAKVSRDSYMVRMAKRFPMYGFEKHKGYGTKMHREALVAHGPSSIHRRTFLHNFLS